MCMKFFVHEFNTWTYCSVSSKRNLHWKYLFEKGKSKIFLPRRGLSIVPYATVPQVPQYHTASIILIFSILIPLHCHTTTVGLVRITKKLFFLWVCFSTLSKYLAASRYVIGFSDFTHCSKLSFANLWKDFNCNESEDENAGENQYCGNDDGCTHNAMQCNGCMVGCLVGWFWD